MYKKRILGLAIASALALSGCDSNDPNIASAGAVTPNNTPAPVVGTFPIFSPATGALPIPNDLIIEQDDETTAISEADGSYRIANSDGSLDLSSPASAALNFISGASTTAGIDVAFSGLIDEATVDGNELIANPDPATSGAQPFIPNPNQNVFLIPLTYASGNPLQGLGLREPPAPTAALDPSIINNGRYEVEVLTLDGASTVRIKPLVPLEPNTRYVVAITNGITDLSGDPITASPGVAGYSALSTQPATANVALDPVQALINGLWEPIAVGLFDSTTNATRTALGLDPIDDTNIALSYSFTTSNDEQVLTYLADPAQWATATIRDSVSVGAAEAALAGGATAFADIATAVGTATATFEASSFSALLGPSCPTATFAPGDAQFACAGSALIGALAGGAILDPANNPIVVNFPTPAALSSTFSTGAGEILDINQVSALTASLGIDPGVVSVSQGVLEDLPYFLGVPDGADGLPLANDSWTADATIAAQLSGVLTGLDPANPVTLAQTDPTQSTVVNSLFPFPEVKSTEDVPVLAIFPTNPAGNPATGMKTVIFQHGITTDRSAALAFGAEIVANAADEGVDVAVIAIDQPLHGIGGITAAEQAALAEQLLVTGGILTDDRIVNGNGELGDFDGVRDQDANPVVNATEQGTVDAVVAGVASAATLGALSPTGCTAVDALDLTNSTGTLTALGAIGLGACNADLGAGAATLATNLTGLLSTQVLEDTVANGGSTIPGLGVTSDSERHFGFTAGAAGAAPTNASPEAISSGSLFINLTNFLNSRDNLRQGSMDLLSLRLSLATMDINGAGPSLDANDVYFIGHSLGTINGLSFVALTDNTTSTADDITATNLLTPGGGVVRLVENSPSFGASIIAGLAGAGITQDQNDYQTFLNVFQATADAGDAVNLADNLTTPTLISLVEGDQTIPNSITDNEFTDGNENNDILSKADIGTLFTFANNEDAPERDDTNIFILQTVLNLPGNSSTAPLSGTEPLATITGATNIDTAASNDLVAEEALITRYITGTHGTPVFPFDLDQAAVFAEMVDQATDMIIDATDITANATVNVDVDLDNDPLTPDVAVPVNVINP